MWMDDVLWKWQNEAAARRAQVWVKHVMVADLLGRPQGYEFDGELVLVGTALPSRQVEVLLLQSGFRPSLATWRAKASDERRRRLPEFVARLSEGPSEGRGLGPQEPTASKQVSDIKELKDRAQHVWMRWYALFKNELATAGRTYQIRGRPTLGERELVLRYRHPSSGAELMLRFDVATHTLHHRTTAAFGGQTIGARRARMGGVPGVRDRRGRCDQAPERAQEERPKLAQVSRRSRQRPRRRTSRRSPGEARGGEGRRSATSCCRRLGGAPTWHAWTRLPSAARARSV
jgi:hypothetical protein